MGNAQIDLGEVRREAPAVVVPDRLTPRRALLALLSIVLVVQVAGAGAPVPPPRPVIIPARLGDTMFLAHDRMMMVSGAPALAAELRRRVVSTYALPSARLLTRTTVMVSGAINQVLRADETILTSYQVDASGAWATVAVAEGTDRTRWRQTARLIAISPEDELVLLGTDEAVRGVDLLTGATRWSLRRAADGYIAEAGWFGDYPRWLVVLNESGRLETRDPRTGALIATRVVPPRPGHENGLILPVDDLVMADEGGPGFGAYRLPGLTSLWHTDADLSQTWMQAGCGRMICAFGHQRGMTALDPATGRELWQSDQWAYAEGIGDYLLATRAERGMDEPGLWVIDPATGRPKGDFGRWEFLAPTGDGRFYAKLDVRGEYRVHYAVLDPATLSVRLLGTVDEVANSCQAAAGLFICRLVDASVAMWPLG